MEENTVLADLRKNSVNLTKNYKLCKAFFPMGVAKVFCKAFAHMICDLTEKLKLQRKFLPYSLFSKPYRNILLHEHWEGCIEIANPKGQIFFIPRGEAPRDEKIFPRDLQFQCIPSNVPAVVFLYSLLNRLEFE